MYSLDHVEYVYIECCTCPTFQQMLKELQFIYYKSCKQICLWKSPSFLNSNLPPIHAYTHTYLHIYIYTYMFVSVWQGAISFSSSSHFYTFLMYVLNCIVLYCFYSSFDFICIYWMVWFYTIFFKGAENIIILMIFIYLVTCYKLEI